MNKAIRAALKALSYPDIDIKKTYKVERTLIALTSTRLIKPPFYKAWDHEIRCDGHKVPVRIFSPSDGRWHPILLFFHGGGWVTGNIDSYDRVCYDMARITKRIVVSVDYRLAPEYPFPAALEDCYAVAKGIYLDSELFHTERKQITVIGDSAGGNLAAAVSLLARDRGEFSVDSQILFYPSTYHDHSEFSPFNSIRENGTDYLLTSKRVCDFIKLYKSCDDDLTNPYFAPLLAKDFSRQPKTLIITAQYCPLRDEGEAYGEKLKQAGNSVEVYRMLDALHGFLSRSPRLQVVKKAYQLVNHFLNEVTSP